MGYQIKRAAVEIVGCHDVVTVLYNVLEGVGDSSCTAADCQSGYTAFKRSYTVFKYALCGIGQTTVDVTSVTQSETVGGML
jgi:hypothetical protein